MQSGQLHVIWIVKAVVVVKILDKLYCVCSDIVLINREPLQIFVNAFMDRNLFFLGEGGAIFL